MKKCICALLLFIGIVSASIVSGADTFEDKSRGISFDIPEGFTEVLLTDTTVMYTSSDYGTNLSVIAETSADAYFEGAFTKEAFETAFKTIYSPERISSALSEINKMHITATPTKTLHGEKTINGVQYATYDAEFEISAYGIENQRYILSAYATAKNGRIYTFALENTTPSEYSLESLAKTVSYESGEIKIVINGEKLISDTPPAAIDNRTLIPIRAVAQKLDYLVEWDAVNQRVTLISEKDKREIIFTLYSPQYAINGSLYELDVPAMAFSGRTYIPLRAATEAMGATVEWKQETNTAEIKK